MTKEPENSNDEMKFIELIQGQLFIRKESIQKRIEKRQQELEKLEVKLSELIEAFQKTSFFENTKKKLLKAEIEKCELRIKETLEANKHDSAELKRLNDI